MREFSSIQKVFIKSNNSTHKINLNYTYSLIFLVILTIILDLIFSYQTDAINLVKSIVISLIVASICAYLINIIKKKYNFKLIYTEDNIIPISLIISLFSKNYSYYITIITVLITLIVKNINPKRNMSSVLYGILFIIIYNFLFNNQLIDSNLTNVNYKIIDFLINPNYISPILSVLAFIYIFHKKSIKYNIIIPYFLTFFSVIFLYTIINDIDMQFILISLSINSLIFLTVYTLGDYEITPTIAETQIIYGIIMGIITIILYFIINDLSVVIPMIIVPLILTKPLEKMSSKLKYNHKVYNLFVTICLGIVILTIIILSVTNCHIFKYII